MARNIEYFKTNLIKSWPFTRIYPVVLSLVTVSTDRIANLIPSMTTTEAELFDKKIDKITTV